MLYKGTDLSPYIYWLKYTSCLLDIKHGIALLCHDLGFIGKSVFSLPFTGLAIYLKTTEIILKNLHA